MIYRLLISVTISAGGVTKMVITSYVRLWKAGFVASKSQDSLIPGVRWFCRRGIVASSYHTPSWPFWAFECHGGRLCVRLELLTCSTSNTLPPVMIYSFARSDPTVLCCTWRSFRLTSSFTSITTFTRACSVCKSTRSCSKTLSGE
jgi:hypothetical protein